MHSFPDLLASSAFVGIQETGCPDAEAALLIFRYGRHVADIRRGFALYCIPERLLDGSCWLFLVPGCCDAKYFCWSASRGRAYVHDSHSGHNVESWELLWCSDHKSSPVVHRAGRWSLCAGIEDGGRVCSCRDRGPRARAHFAQNPSVHRPKLWRGRRARRGLNNARASELREIEKETGVSPPACHCQPYCKPT
jgi:hypothetical protein